MRIESTLRISKVAAVGLFVGVVGVVGVSCDNKPVCGDGVVERGEECDDGNEAGWDGCDACRITACGNGVVDEDQGEECDDGSPTGWDGCTGCRFAEVQVNVPPFDWPGDRPKVAVHADGRFVVVWQGEDSEMSETRIYAQRFDADGARAGDPLDVSIQTTGGSAPAVAMASDGSFMVAWGTSDQLEQESIIVGRRFHSSGAAEGETFRVGRRALISGRPSVLAAPDDRFLVAWKDGAGSWDGQILGQWYLADGTADGSSVLLADEPEDNLVIGLVALQDATRLVAVWTRSHVGIVDLQPFAQRLTSDGTPLGPPIAIGGWDGSVKGLRDVVAFPDGKITVVLSVEREMATQTVGPDGAVLSPPERLSDDSRMGSSIALASVASSDSVGVIIWTSARPNDDTTYREHFLTGRLITSTGQPVGEDFQVNTTFADDLLMYDDTFTSRGTISPAVGMAAGGSFVVVWNVSGIIFAKRFSAEGVGLGR